MATNFSNDKVLDIAWYFLDNRSTVRDTSEHFNISKTSIWYLLNKRLNLIDPILFLEVRKLLEYNKEVASLRGGMATREKYLAEKIY